MFEIELANGRITVSVLAFVHSGSSGDAGRRWRRVRRFVPPPVRRSRQASRMGTL